MPLIYYIRFPLTPLGRGLSFLLVGDSWGANSPERVSAVRRAKIDADDDKVAVLRRLLLAAEVWSDRRWNQLCRFPALVFVGAARARRHEGRDLLGGLDVVAGDGGGDGRHRLVGQDRPKGGFGFHGKSLWAPSFSSLKEFRTLTLLKGLENQF